MKVFVSSTSADLTNFRAAAIRSLRRLGHQVIAMEDFAATASFPLDHVLTLVRQSDAFLVLVAWRYGFLPDVSKASALPAHSDAHERKSITEWEYLAAQEAKRPILAFILAEDAPWPPHQMDGFNPHAPGDPGSLDRVRAFRTALMTEHIVSFFSRDDQLEALVSAAVTSARVSRGVLVNSIPLGTPVQGRRTVPDSSYSGEMVEIISKAGAERVITIDIATCWWSTRLYLLAFLLRRLTRVQRILVVHDGRFVGLVPLDPVIRVVAGHHDQLRRFEDMDRARLKPQPDIGREAKELADLFAMSFRTNPPAGEPDEIVAGAGPQQSQRIEPEELEKVDVSEANLSRWFQDSLLTEPIRLTNIERASPLDLIRLFDYPGDFVPVIEGGGADAGMGSRSFVIDKPALSVQLARAYVTDLFDESLS